MIAYPIKFAPILVEKIWGGKKLQTYLGKQSSNANVGESWEISEVNGHVSKVTNGHYVGQDLKDLIKNHGAKFLGNYCINEFGYQFPLLIKFLDANTDLSVQVHPDDSMAKKYHNSFGKTEMWYIMQSDSDANIILGLKDEYQNAEILQNINSENVEAIFNRKSVEKGDCFFIPAGEVHAMGAGVLAAEIQQTSDITYRVYDWDRVDSNGQQRELHTDLALEATKYFEKNDRIKYDHIPNETNSLVDCSFFKTNLLEITKPQIKDYQTLDSFVVLMCVEGEAELIISDFTENIKMGETILLPATTAQVYIDSKNVRLLEIFITQN